MTHAFRSDLLFLGFSVVLLAAGAALTQPREEERVPPPREYGVFRLQVPSEAAGKEGVAVRLLLPERPRYGLDGAPVVVVVPGGVGPGSLDGPRPGAPALGLASIEFAFPGGPGSGGSYDVRGPACLLALRDVVRFALGEQASTEGKTIQEYAGNELKVQTRNVGLLGLSNGGNQAVAAAGLHGPRLRNLAWIVNWESPLGPGMVNGELGTWGGGPRKPDEKPNPTVNPAYDPATGRLNPAPLAYDPDLAVWPFPLPPEELDPEKLPRGGLYFDVNGNGKVDRGTDFVLSAVFGQGKEGVRAYYSFPVHAEAEVRNLYGGPRPAHLASAEEAREFWAYRDGSLWVGHAAAACPRLMFLVVASVRDHVQTAPDHPHIRTQYNAFREASGWVTRLNPDRVYVQAVAGKSVKAVDNPARAVFDIPTIRKALEPEPSAGGARAPLLWLAAVCELADRTQADKAAPDLDELLYLGPALP